MVCQSLLKSRCHITATGSLSQLWVCFRLIYVKVLKTQKCKLRWRSCDFLGDPSPQPCSLLYAALYDDYWMTDMISRLSGRISSWSLRLSFHGGFFVGKDGCTVYIAWLFYFVWDKIPNTINLFLGYFIVLYCLSKIFNIAWVFLFWLL